MSVFNNDRRSLTVDDKIARVVAAKVEQHIAIFGKNEAQFLSTGSRLRMRSD